jgi:hypothetical protein
METELEALRAAAEDALHELTTLHGLRVCDDATAASSAETWRIDTLRSTQRLEHALEQEANTELRALARDLMRDMLAMNEALGTVGSSNKLGYWDRQLQRRLAQVAELGIEH